MSIAEKLTTVAENVPKVYEQGKSHGYLDGHNAGFNSGYKTGYNEGEAIGWDEGYSAGWDEGWESGWLEGHDKGYEVGIQAERDSLWGTLQNNAHGNFYYAFAYDRFNDKTFNPTQDFTAASNANSFQNMFYSNGKITDTKVGFDARKTSHIGAMFYNAKNLKKIRKIIIGSNVVSGGNSAFTGCKNLENITVEGEICLSLNMKDCSGLSRVSLENIVNHLSDNTNDLTLTLSQTAIDNAFETSDGAGDGSASVEWAELIADKTNWTISLL